MHVNLLLLLILHVAGHPGASWQYAEYGDAEFGRYAHPPNYVPLQPPSYGGPLPSYAEPPRGYSSQPSSQVSRRAADAGRLGPATPPSESRILDALQTLPPQLRPPTPQHLPFIVDNKVIDRNVLASEKAKYAKAIKQHLDMMDRRHNNELDGLEAQHKSVRQDIEAQIDKLLKYKLDQLDAEYNKGLQSLKQQAQSQKKELEKRAAHMAETRNAEIDEKLLDMVRTLDSSTNQHAQTVREVARAHERTFDEAVDLLKGYNQELRQSKEEYEFRAKEDFDLRTFSAEERLKRHVESRMGLFT